MDDGAIDWRAAGHAWATKDGPPSVYEVIRASAEQQPDRDAMIYLEDGTVDGGSRRWTYGEFIGEVTQAANAFRRAGLGRHDVVSVLMPIRPESQVALWAGETAGIANPVNDYLLVDQIAHILNAAQTRILVTQGPSHRDLWAKVVELMDRVPSITTLVTVDNDPPIGVDWTAFVSTCPRDELEFAEPGADDVAAYFHTGGTTGLPKLAKHTHHNQVFDAAAIVHALDWASHNAAFLGGPLFHTGGAVLCSLGSFTAGTTIVMPGPLGFRNPRAIQGFWKTVETHSVDMLIAVATVLASILEVPATRAQASSLKFTLVGSAPVPLALAERWEATIGHQPFTGWGLTEGTCQSAVTPVSRPRKVGSVGPALPGCEIRVVDYELDSRVDPRSVRDCDPGEVGLVITRGPNVFAGYVEAEHDRGVLLADGWLNTGDLGRMDSEGDLWITGRAKDLVKRSGHGIDPANVEESIARHHQVLAVAVVGRPDVYAGELPIAYVQLRPGAEGFDLVAFQSWCKESAADPAAAPVEVIVLGEMPVTSVGKISKVELRWDASRRAIEQEISAAFAAPTVNFEFDLTDLKDRYVGHVLARGASQRSIDLLRRRLDLISVPNEVTIDALETPTRHLSGQAAEGLARSQHSQSRGDSRTKVHS